MQLVKQWTQSAVTGKALGIPAGDQQNLSTVQNIWGKTGPGTYAGAGVYYSYPAHSTVFGVNKGGQIFDVRSHAAKVQQITQQDVTSAIGPPGAVLYADNTTIYLYTAGVDYQILWVFRGGEGHTGQYVDHVDVVWPQGTVNLMAQNVPNPSISIIPTSAVSSSSLKFAIKNAPAGYHLMELEWLPAGSHGTTVVNTKAQAVMNAQNNTPGPLFVANNGDYRLDYTSTMASQSGTVRLIYESPRGNAIIGTSQPITLK